MSDFHTSNHKDRFLQKGLTNKIINEYFHRSESWLRAILRMSIFSMTWIDGQSAVLIECPNQAIAKRLSRKISSLQQVVQSLTTTYPSSRILICYREVNQSWRCFDTNSNTWKTWESLQTPTASPDN